MKKLAIALALTGALALTTPVPTQAAPHTPVKGSSERAAILNSLRRVLGGGKHKPLITPGAFHVENGWAYLNGGSQYEDGAPLEKQFTEGSGTNFTALLHLEGQGKNRGWKVKRRVYNGDVVVDEFKKAFPAAPRAIFKDE